MSIKVCAELEQLDQINSKLNAVGTIDSQVSQENQIDSDLQNVLPIDIVAEYKGNITINDWVLNGSYYYFLIAKSTHKLINPYVDTLLRQDPNGYENCIFSFTQLPNNDIRIRSSIAVNCKFIIKGER